MSSDTPGYQYQFANAGTVCTVRCASLLAVLLARSLLPTANKAYTFAPRDPDPGQHLRLTLPWTTCAPVQSHSKWWLAQQPWPSALLQ